MHHLRKVAQASEYRVTLDQIANAAGISIVDEAAELKNIKVVRGYIYQCNMGDVMDSEQGGIRPVIVLQNKLGNDRSGNSIIAPITSAISKNKMPTHVPIGFECGLYKVSEVQLEHIRTISKRRLLFNGELQKIGEVPEHIMQQIDSAIKKSIGLIPLFFDENIAKEYLKGIQGIEDAKKLRNTLGLQIAEDIIMNKFEEYCSDYDIDHNRILEKYNSYRNEKILQKRMIFNGAKYTEALSTV